MRRSKLAQLVFPALLAFGMCAHAAGAASPKRLVSAAAIVSKLVAGRPVVYRNVVVRGRLGIPAQVQAPLSLQDSVIEGTVVGAATEFHSLVDFSGTRFDGRVELSAVRFDGPLLLVGASTAAGRRARFTFAAFDGPAVVAKAKFGGSVSFAGAQFHGESRFEGDEFAGPATFAFASFDHDADFSQTTFDDAASFARAELRSTSDFSSAQFGGGTVFDGARFFGPTDFTAAMFMPATARVRRPSFRFVHFGAGGDFVQSTFANGADFDLADSTGELDFEGAMFEQSASFSTVRFAARADFDHAEFHGLLNFDQADLDELDLDGAQLATTSVVLPDAKNGVGGLAQLRMDPNDVSHVKVGPGAEPRQVRERALELIETAARSGGDLSAAARAGVRRLTLHRSDENAFVRLLDWTFYWQIGGYFLRPLHPLVAILVLILVAAAVRTVRAPAARTGWHRAGRFVLELPAGIDAVWRGGGKGRLDRVEAWLQKILLAVLALNIANVWPPVAQLLKGVLP